jgi:hypothetical protein
MSAQCWQMPGSLPVCETEFSNSLRLSTIILNKDVKSNILTITQLGNQGMKHRIVCLHCSPLHNFNAKRFISSRAGNPVIIVE